MRKFAYHQPKNLEAAFRLLDRYGEDGAVLAGGTDLLVEMKKRRRSPSHLIDIKGLKSLGGLSPGAEGSLRIGPLTTLSTLSHSPLLADGWSLLAQAASKVGSLQVRNRATLGGNICHASPSGDTLPALLCLDARLKLACRGGERTLPLKEFFLGPGRCALGPGEVLAEILLPPTAAGARGVYKKFSLKRAVDLAVAGVAVLGSFDPSTGMMGNIRVSLGAVAPTPIRAEKAENVLREAPISEDLIHKAAVSAAEEARPISDMRGAEWYRREMIRRLTAEAVREIAAPLR